MPPSPTDVAWAAGLFDGEGCVGVYANHNHMPWGSKKYWVLVARLSMVDREAVERFYSIVGVGRIRTKPMPGNRRDQREWATEARQSEVAMRLLLPYSVGNKREQIELALAFRETYSSSRRQGKLSEETLEQREKFSKELKRLKYVA